MHDFMGMGGWVGLIANIYTDFTESAGSIVGGKKIQAYQRETLEAGGSDLRRNLKRTHYK